MATLFADPFNALFQFQQALDVTLPKDVERRVGAGELGPEPSHPLVRKATQTGSRPNTETGF